MGDAARGLIYLHGQGTVHGDLKGVGSLGLPPLLISDISLTKANILIDETGRACLADFGLLTIISDATSLVSSSPLTHGGTYRWMSPELLYPDDFGLGDSRRTKYSDCYALGMVIHEVLSGRVPFFSYETPAVIVKVGRGERPERPQGAEGELFTDVVWKILERCWTPKRDDRPSAEEVLLFLEEASRSWTPLSALTVEGPLAMDSPIWSLSDPSTEESTGKDEVPSLTQPASPQPPRTLPPKGGAPLCDALDHQNPRIRVKKPNGSGLEGSVGIPDTVGGPGLLDDFRY